MILKYFLIFLSMTYFITASDQHFGTELSWKPTPKLPVSDEVRELAWMSTEAFKSYLSDYDDRVSDHFQVTPYYYPTVNFWFLVYTQFTSNHIVIHDKNNLSLIYKVLDFSSLNAKNLPDNTIYILQKKIAEEKLDQLKDDLKLLSQNPFSLEPRAKILYRTFKQAGIQIPINKDERIRFFNKLRDNIRTQTGQKNFIRDGIKRSLPYKTFLTKFFSETGLPVEILAVPFLESSFNPKAESKVSALGVWQFMPLIASYYIPKRSRYLDYRSNVGVSSIAAAYLMSENHRLMKTWDLTVTAYNSGTKHLLKTKRELASSNVDLEDIIKHSDSQHFGFASKNFYSEFLALVHALAYEEELFEELHKNEDENVEENLRFYLTKCSLRFDRVLDDRELQDVLYHNHQIQDEDRFYPKGTIVTTKLALSKKAFLEVKFSTLLKSKPKEWSRLVLNQSCSTK